MGSGLVFLDSFEISLAPYMSSAAGYGTSAKPCPSAGESSLSADACHASAPGMRSASAKNRLSSSVGSNARESSPPQPEGSSCASSSGSDSTPDAPDCPAEFCISFSTRLGLS